MKRILIVLAAVLVLGGTFFGGVLCGSRYQRELFYGNAEDEKTTENSQQEESRNDPVNINKDVLEEMLEDHYTNGGKYKESLFNDCFKYVSVRDDGKGLAVGIGPSGMGSNDEWWYVTSDSGKNWEYLTEYEYPNAISDYAYVGDKVVRVQSGGEFSVCWAETFADHGKTQVELVPFETLSGISDLTDTEIRILNENHKNGTFTVGVLPEATEDASAEDYIFVAEYDMELSLVKEITRK